MHVDRIYESREPTCTSAEKYVQYIIYEMRFQELYFSSHIYSTCVLKFNTEENSHLIVEISEANRSLGLHSFGFGIPTFSCLINISQIHSVSYRLLSNVATSVRVLRVVYPAVRTHPYRISDLCQLNERWAKLHASLACSMSPHFSWYEKYIQHSPILKNIAARICERRLSEKTNSISHG